MLMILSPLDEDIGSSSRSSSQSKLQARQMLAKQENGRRRRLLQTLPVIDQLLACIRPLLFTLLTCLGEASIKKWYFYYPSHSISNWFSAQNEIYICRLLSSAPDNPPSSAWGERSTCHPTPGYHPNNRSKEHFILSTSLVNTIKWWWQWWWWWQSWWWY